MSEGQMTPQLLPEKIFDKKNDLDKEIGDLEKSGYRVNLYGLDCEGYEGHIAIRGDNDIVFLRLKVKNMVFAGSLNMPEEINLFFSDHKDHKIIIEDFSHEKAFRAACMDCGKYFKITYPMYCAGYNCFSDLTKKSFSVFFEEMAAKPLIIVSNSIDG